WASLPLQGWRRGGGVGLGIAAIGLFCWTLRTLGPNLTDTVVTRRDARLITHGPYRWVRHPFYVAFAVAVVANSLVTSNWYLALIGVAAMLAIVVRTPIEEKKLIDRFGDQYLKYARQTGRFLPRSVRGPKRSAESDQP
ncbi:MAG: methyltransferase family protein, partial [Aeoliella sp.]